MGNKFYRVSGCVALSLVLALFFGSRQMTSQAEEQQTEDASVSDPSVSVTEGQDMSEMFKGTVVDVVHAGRHIYLQIDTGEKPVWVAVTSFDGKVGDTVIVPPGVPSAHFHSKALNRDFEMIYFVGGIQRADGSTGDN
jgi:oxalate decarboxylase/phosphoglucose isomerase-like protein (cupin superfamily)